jgi:ABC-type Na+ efflux pump permease subunit
MRKVWLVTTTGIKNVLRMRIVLVILIPITLICVVGIALLLCLLLIGPEAQSASPDKDLLEGYIGLILYSSTLISIGVTLNSLVFQTMVREKSRGNLAALLATPLKASEIWLGKSLALFIPGWYWE